MVINFNWKDAFHANAVCRWNINFMNNEWKAYQIDGHKTFYGSFGYVLNSVSQWETAWHKRDILEGSKPTITIEGE